MDTFGLKIIASDKVFYEGRCRKLIIPAPDGEKGILANHARMSGRTWRWAPDSQRSSTTV